MNIADTPEYRRQNLTIIQDVKHALIKLQKDIPAAELDVLKNFNQTYLIITQNVEQTVQKDKFDHPGFLNNFDAVFASYYLDALKNYLRGNDIVVPPAWRYAFESAEAGEVSPFKSTVLGVNAHINNDIPQVLYETSAGDEHIRDYYSVNAIIQQSIDEVLYKLEDSKQLLNPKRRLLRPFYKAMLFGLVVMFRRLAWRNFRLLERGKIQRYRIELRSKRAAQFIRLLPI